jgi:hypothetical protein
MKTQVPGGSIINELIARKYGPVYPNMIKTGEDIMISSPVFTIFEYT